MGIVFFTYFCNMKPLRKLTFLLSPISHELPFMVAFLVLMGIKWSRQLRFFIFGTDARATLIEVVGQLAFLFLMAYLLAALIRVVNRKWFRMMLYALVIALFGIEMFMEKNFLMTISPNSLILVAETNGNEVENFLSMYMLTPASIQTYIWVLVAAVSAYLLERFYRKKTWKKVSAFFSNKAWLALPLSLWLLFGCYSGKSLVYMLSTDNADEFYIDYEWQDIHPEDPISSLFRSFYGIHIAKKEMRRAVEVTTHMRKDASVVFNDTVQVVLVIGESYNKWHSPLHGYPLNTAPNMMRERDNDQLFVFSDVLSPFNHTSPTLKNLLCCNSLAHNEPWCESPYFPAVIRQAGYQVQLWDNQNDVGLGTISSFALNSFIYDPQMVEFCYSASNEERKEYDGVLIDDYLQKNFPLNGRNFSIIHLLGQHFDAANQFPHEPRFMRFSADSISRKDAFLTPYMRERIALYDNATYYNDYCMGRLFEAFRGMNAVIVYLSDHGEEVFDYRDFEGRDAPNNHAEGNRLKNQFMVPFMVWCSEKYMSNHPEVVELLGKAKDSPFLTDNLCHLMFHLAGVQTSYYVAERDILSPFFKPTKRVGVSKY